MTRILVHVRGGEAQGPASGLDRMKLGLIGDLGAAFFESHCELNDKTSSPFSSNRTMFETEEARLPQQKIIYQIVIPDQSFSVLACLRW